jgi:hypothetical protein
LLNDVIAMGTDALGTARQVVVPVEISSREAAFVLDALARVKRRRFGRLALTISDGRLVDVEILEKLDRAMYQHF